MKSRAGYCLQTFGFTDLMPVPKRLYDFKHVMRLFFFTLKRKRLINEIIEGCIESVTTTQSGVVEPGRFRCPCSWQAKHLQTN